MAKKKVGKTAKSRQSFKSTLRSGLTRSRKGNWGTWEQRLWKVTDPDHPFNN